MTTRSDGPAWCDVFRRVTIDTSTGETVEDIMISSESRGNIILHQPLPLGVTQTTTILHYHVNITSVIGSYQERLITIAGENNDASSDAENSKSYTELDSHANMAVVGSEAFIISYTGQKAHVQPYSPDYEHREIEIVQAAIQYDCPYTGKENILVIQNAFYVHSMKNNLIPPFIIREAGVQLKDTPKIQMDDPGIDDHAIYFKETDFRIPLQLKGIFSVFPTSKPTRNTLLNSENVYLLTTESIDTH